MSVTPLGAPLHVPRAGGQPPEVDGRRPLEATKGTIETFSRELGELNHQTREAARKGEVVTNARIKLEYEVHGKLLSAEKGEAQVHSKTPEPTPVEHVAEQTKEPAPAEQADVLQVQADAAERMAKLAPPKVELPAPPAERPEPEQPRLDASA